LEASENSAVDSITIPEVIGVYNNFIGYAHTGYSSGNSIMEKNVMPGELFQHFIKNIDASTYFLFSMMAGYIK